MPLRAAFALCRGSCCAVANYLEVSFQTFRDFIYTAVARNKKFVIISFKLNVMGTFRACLGGGGVEGVWRGCGAGGEGGGGKGVKKGGGEGEREREGCFL